MAFQDDRSSKPAKSIVDAHKAALEALFAPRVPSPTPPAVAKRDSAKPIVAKKRTDAVDPAREAEHAKLTAKLLAAEGRVAVTRHADELLRRGFPFPAEQEVHLQLLDHADEARVREALVVLDGLLSAEAPKRRAVLDTRLRRLEEGDGEEATRAAAGALRRKLSGR